MLPFDVRQAVDLQTVAYRRREVYPCTLPSLYWIVMPNTVLFNILMPALIPIVDGMLILGLLGLIDLRTAIAPFLIYTALDMWYAIEGVANERGASLRLISIVIWQRFFYRYTDTGLVPSPIRISPWQIMTA